MGYNHQPYIHINLSGLGKDTSRDSYNVNTQASILKSWFLFSPSCKLLQPFLFSAHLSIATVSHSLSPHVMRDDRKIGKKKAKVKLAYFTAFQISFVRRLKKSLPLFSPSFFRFVLHFCCCWCRCSAFLDNLTSWTIERRKKRERYRCNRCSSWWVGRNGLLDKAGIRLVSCRLIVASIVAFIHERKQPVLELQLIEGWLFSWDRGL